MTRYENELHFIKETILDVYSKYCLDKMDINIRNKEQFDIVTDLDINIENEIINRINDEYPKDAILSEETNPSQILKGRTWILDPIDGTFNMSRDIPLFGIQSALICDGCVVVSVMYLPQQNEMYTAELNCGAFLNSKRITAKKNTPLDRALISTGDYSHSNNNLSDLQYSIMNRIRKDVAKTRMFGSACVDCTFVASGKTDATIIMTRNLWDLIPGILMCSEAGCLISNLEGHPYNFGDAGILVSSNPLLFDYLKKALIECANDLK
ncbi:MAG: inositol monophosphatase [Thermoplasmatales archaeon]|jgi:myo-inositol-1(or 4)-monophosphatase|nr:inositol monophosphatase [Thermoplasmatales archaeon]